MWERSVLIFIRKHWKQSLQISKPFSSHPAVILMLTESGGTEWVLIRLSGQWARCHSDIKWAIPQFNGFIRNSHGRGSESRGMMSTKRRWESAHSCSLTRWVSTWDRGQLRLAIPPSLLLFSLTWSSSEQSGGWKPGNELGSVAPCDLLVLQALSVNGLQTMAWDLQGNWRERRPKLWWYKKLAPLSRIQFNTGLVKTVQSS